MCLFLWWFRNISCQGWSIDIFSSYLIKGLIYFSFSTISLISNCSDSEKFLKNRRLALPSPSLYHYKVDIFSFLTPSLISDYSASERFLIIELVIRQKNFFSPYPLRGKNIFLKKYCSDIFIFIVIERILIIGLVGLVIFSLPIH